MMILIKCCRRVNCLMILVFLSIIFTPRFCYGSRTLQQMTNNNNRILQSSQGNSSLCDLAAALNPSTWSSFYGWTCTNNVPNSVVCSGSQSSWSGIHCSGGEVTAIVLENADLEGSIPTSISSLTSLTRISLRQNSITGTIPASISKLSALQNLNLQFNSLSGSIPEALTSLPVLSFLGLSSNILSRSIPTSLGKTSVLNYVLLYDNLLTGSIPSSLCGSTQLQVLLLYYPQQQSYTKNSHLKCYAQCLSTVPNKGYSMAYGPLKVCKTTSSMLDKARDFFSFGGSQYVGYAVIAAIVIFTATALVCMWRCCQRACCPNQSQDASRGSAGAAYRTEDHHNVQGGRAGYEGGAQPHATPTVIYITMPPSQPHSESIPYPVATATATVPPRPVYVPASAPPFR